MQVVARRKKQLFGHITRMDNSRKIKVVMKGIIEGENKRGRPPREWLDDIMQRLVSQRYQYVKPHGTRQSAMGANDL